MRVTILSFHLPMNVQSFIRRYISLLIRWDLCAIAYVWMIVNNDFMTFASSPSHFIAQLICFGMKRRALRRKWGIKDEMGSSRRAVKEMKFEGKEEKKVDKLKDVVNLKSKETFKAYFWGKEKKKKNTFLMRRLKEGMILGM
jgi:hypothetical protein